MDSWIFYTLKYNSIFPYLFCYSNVGFCVPLAYLNHCAVLFCFVLFFLNTSFLSGTKRYSRLIVCIFSPSPRISHFLMEPSPIKFIMSPPNELEEIFLLFLYWKIWFTIGILHYFMFSGIFLQSLILLCVLVG